ncbi:MAG: ABC transporter ATP-binding protein [Rubrobacteraceae bacterium]
MKELLSFGKVKHGHDFWALKDIDLEIEPGSSVGILGRNGAGKSTLLKIVSGVLQPSSGSIEVEGRLAALLQLGAGFNPEFTGRENVMLNGLILGVERREMLERFDGIAAFADIGEFMEQPVKTYSSGMRARLGFAVAVNVEPDILIVDETLSVGDAVFKHMGLQRMRELRDSGTTIFFVSHSTGMVKNFCNEAVLLHQGSMIARGDTAEVADRYQALLSSVEAQRSGVIASSEQSQDYDMDDEEAADGAPSFKPDPELERRSSNFRHGTGEARISNVELLDETGAPTEEVIQDSAVTVRTHVEYREKLSGSVVSITIRNRAGLDVFSTNTQLEKTKIGATDSGDRRVVDFSFEVPLQDGPYSVSAAIAHLRNRNVYMDWVDVAAVFRVERPQDRGAVKGLIYIPATIKVHAPDRKQQRRSA